MNEGVMIPAIIFFSFFGYLAWRRYLEYKETAVLAAHGMTRQRKPSDGRDTLRWGIAIASLGLALTIGLYPVGWLLADQADLSFPLGLGPWLLVGLVPLFFGLGLILIYAITGPVPNDAKPGTNDPAVGSGDATWSGADDLLPTPVAAAEDQIVPAGAEESDVSRA